MSRKYKITAACAALILLFSAFFFFYQKQQEKQTEPVSVTGFKLNTMIKITVYDKINTELLEHAMALCDTYESLFSRTLSTSEIYKLNHGTLPEKNGFFEVSPETAELVRKGLYYAELSEGAFDLSLAPVSSLWDFTSEEKVIPEPDALKNALPLVDYKNITVEGNTIHFEKEGMGLDLGAIAKGYIADKIKEFLVSKGVKSGIINLGGNVLCIGSQPDGTPFKIGIQKPFSDRGETSITINVSDKSVVSSGIYERYFKKDGILYHHILNPKTGMPYKNGLVSVTILSDQSVDGDALSTSCFALGAKKGMELVESLENTEAVFITENGEFLYSSGFPVSDK